MIVPLVPLALRVPVFSMYSGLPDAPFTTIDEPCNVVPPAVAKASVLTVSVELQETVPLPTYTDSLVPPLAVIVVAPVRFWLPRNSTSLPLAADPRAEMLIDGLPEPVAEIVPTVLL